MTGPDATDPPGLTPEQCRRAREMLGWTQEQLGGEAGLTPRTIGRFECGTRRTWTSTAGLIARALATAGVEFLPDGGVRLRERRRA